MSGFTRNHKPIRKVIELLCMILDENGVCSVKAETLRKAKFNDDNVAPSLWKLVYDVLCHNNSTTDHKQCVGPEGTSNFVKFKLLEKKYDSKELLDLSNDMKKGSRELLLAFGWLLCNDQFIQKMMLMKTNILDDSDGSLVDFFDIGTGTCNNSMLPNDSLKNGVPDPFARIQKLLILNNKLRLNLCNLYSFQREFYTLKHRIYEATSHNSEKCNVKSVSHMDVIELQLLKSPDKLEKYLDLLVKDNRSLENFLKWKECQGTFWEWMSSVLDLKLSQLKCDVPITSSHTFSHLQHDVSRNLSETYTYLEDAVNEYDQVLKHLEQLCKEQSDGVPTEHLDSMVSIIEEEIDRCKTAMHQRNNHSVMFRKDNGMIQQTSSFLDSMKEIRTLQDVGGIDIRDEIRTLKKDISLLEAFLAMQQNKLNVELDQLNTKLGKYYCIPPLIKPQLLNLR